MEGIRDIFDRLVVAEGLVPLGAVALECGQDYERFSIWLDESRHAGMEYLTRYREERKDPKRLFPEAKVALIVGMPYFVGDQSGSPKVAQYARLPDYHRVLKRKAERVFDRLASEAGLSESPRYRITVDTAPVLERALAAKTAKGFIGKNTCYIHPERGSFLLLAEIFTSLAFPIDEHLEIDPAIKTPQGGCGACVRCQEACPTGALNRDYTIDSDRCLAYWTIEHRGTIPEEFWPWMAKYYFGCDLCQLACPYNWKAEGNGPPPDVESRDFPSLFETAVMGQQEYERFFGGTPMTRAKRNGLRRNALIAMTVTADPRLGEAITAAQRDCASPVGETIEQIQNWITKSEGRSLNSPPSEKME